MTPCDPFILPNIIPASIISDHSGVGATLGATTVISLFFNSFPAENYGNTSAEMAPLRQAATLSPTRTQIFVTFSVDDTPLYLPHAFTMVYATLKMCGGLHPRRVHPLRAVRETFQA